MLDPDPYLMNTDPKHCLVKLTLKNIHDLTGRQENPIDTDFDLPAPLLLDSTFKLIL